MTTTKKFKTNPVAKKIKQENIERSEQAKQALENAAQVRKNLDKMIKETPNKAAQYKKFNSKPHTSNVPVSKNYVANLANEAYENAAQVKEWSKYDVQETPSSIALVFAGLFLGVVVAMILVTPSIIQACN